MEWVLASYVSKIFNCVCKMGDCLLYRCMYIHVNYVEIECKGG